LDNQREIRKNFGKRASKYRKSTTHGNQEDLLRMLKLLKPLPDTVALDVATGGGHTAVALAKYVQKVIAIDITPEMLEEAAIHAAKNCVTNIEFQISDVHNLPFATGQFDLVTSRFAPHHFYDIKTALQEMCRVLKPGGLLYILDCSVYDGAETEREINRIEYLRDNSHICSYSPRQWQELLQKLPLKLLQTSFIQTRYVLPDWFERMEVEQSTRQEVFKVLDSLSAEAKALYPYDANYITTYRFEFVAAKLS